MSLLFGGLKIRELRNSIKRFRGRIFVWQMVVFMLLDLLHKINLLVDFNFLVFIWNDGKPTDNGDMIEYRSQVLGIYIVTFLLSLAPRIYAAIRLTLKFRKRNKS